ncbi:MAG: ATP-dependent helicase HrpA, partial [Verrucomicrobiota bacterium]
MISYPKDLPITLRREEILAALRSHPVVIIAGETGSGKTTQIPKLCLEAGLARNGRIGCTQPRRVAALSISRRVAEELGVPWGREVGCKMRFQDHTARQTVVKFMTDGILLAEIQSDPQLRAYSTLILDEAHERSLNIDFLIGHLRNLIAVRKDLHVVITSATIDTGAFSEAFGGAPVIEVSGRLYPVETRYAPPLSFARPGEDPSEITHIEAAVRATEDALIESEHGDVLVFMPTERDIHETRDLLQACLGSGTEILTLFSRMSGQE